MTTDTISTYLAWYLAALAVYAAWRAVRWVALALTGSLEGRPRRRRRGNGALAHRNWELD